MKLGRDVVMMMIVRFEWWWLRVLGVGIVQDGLGKGGVGWLEGVGERLRGKEGIGHC